MSLALAVAVVAVTGCGGGDRLSREEYARQADEICRKYEAELHEVEQELVRAESPDDVAAAIDRGIPVVERGVADLRALEPPEELQDDVERWLELNEENAKTLERLRDAAHENDAAELQRVATEADENERRADELARKIGLDDCAEDG